MFSKLNLKTRMLVTICSVVLIAFSATIAFVAVKARSMAKTEAMDKAEQIAYRYGGVVEAELEVGLDAARTIAQMFEGIKKTTEIPNRGQLNGMLKQVLESNPEFLAVWTCWEPNATDGRDADFVGKEGHDTTGRFIPYWNRGAGTSVLEALVDYEKPGAGDYYLLSRQSGKETIIEPYSYVIAGKEMLITSMVAPIEYDGKVIGVAGIDMSLTAFADMVSGIKPFESGNAAVISNNGMYAAHPEGKRIGKDIGTSEVWTNAKKAVNAGRSFSATDDSVLLLTRVERVLVPIQIGSTTTPWSFLVNIPLDKVMAKANGIVRSSIIIGVIFLSALIGVVFFIAKSIADPMNRIIISMNQGSEQVSAAAGEVSAASQSLAEGASEQAASVEETSSSLEEMSAMTKQNAENARQADGLMKEANRVVNQANAFMGNLTTSMSEISAASEETSKIIKTIDEIAFQTNLLALNAAVEAARAGEVGAGFAVVADEVRSLAMRAAAAAKNTAAMIEGTVTKVKGGSDLLAKTNEAFSHVARSASRVGELVGEIAVASHEQSEGIEQVNKAVAEMDKVIQGNAASAEESAGASEELTAQAQQMKDMVNELVGLIKGAAFGSGDMESTLSRTTTIPRRKPGVNSTTERKKRKAISPRQPRQRLLTDNDGGENF